MLVGVAPSLIPTLWNIHCKYIRWEYDQITAIHSTTTIFHCNVPLQLNIPIATITYPKNSSKLMVEYY